MNLPGCYKATVNESETITEAKPISVVGGETGGPDAIGFGRSFALPVGRSVKPHVERS